MLKSLKRLCCDQRGATAIEYGLIAALIVIGMLVGLQAFADATTSMMDGVSSSVSQAVD